MRETREEVCFTLKVKLIKLFRHECFTNAKDYLGTHMYVYLTS